MDIQETATAHRRDITQTWRDRTTLTVEEAAQVLGIGRSHAYRIAGTELPVIRCGRKMLVPTKRLQRMLGETE
jgi:excisionase family DNA binding protein